MSINVIVSGATGRVGKLIIGLIESSSEFTLISTISSKTSLDSLRGKFTATDVIIDFSTPTSIENCLNFLLKNNISIPFISGTTGLSDHILNVITKYSKNAPILLDSNMSLGVNIVFKIVEEISKIINRENNYNVTITDVHHKNKIDSPSGTALKLYNIIKQGDSSLIKEAAKSISSTRDGDVIGDHSILFNSIDEDIEISHRAKNREIFAKGALVAAKMVISKSSGEYTMKDVLL